VRGQPKDGYSETGRPSIGPELLLHLLLLGYLCGITSERKLVEKRAWTWLGAGSRVWVSSPDFNNWLSFDLETTAPIAVECAA
jgi:transposase